jgi:Tfp pilus assembly protein PilF
VTTRWVLVISAQLHSRALRRSTNTGSRLACGAVLPVERVGILICILPLWAAVACGHAASAATVTTTPGRVAPTAATRFASPYAYEWFIRAELLRASGQLQAAIEAYRMALSDADEEADVLARLGSALDEQGKHAPADEAIAQALRLEPMSEAAWLARAELTARRGDAAGTLAALERAEQAEPQSPRAPMALASWLRAHGQPERASAVLLRYEARTLSGTRAAQQVRLQRALAEGDPDDVFAATLPYRLFAMPPPAALLEAAQLLFDHQRPAHALRVIELVPETDNESPLRLRIFLACARWAAAENWLATHDAPTHAARLELARAQLTLHHSDQAAQIIEAERMHVPDDPALQLLAAQLELARGAYASAAAQFATIPCGSSAATAARLGLAQALTAGGMPELALEVATQTAACSGAAQ